MTVTHSGAKDWPVTIEWKDTERTAGGGVKEIWDPPADSVEMMASRSDKHGGEDYEASQKVGHGEVSWRIWYRADINSADCRVIDGTTGDAYDINSTRVIGRRQELELMTEIKDNE